MKRIGLLLFLSLFVFPSGCKAPEPRAPIDSSTERREGGRLLRRLAASPATLNALLASTGDERDVLGYVHDALVEFDREMKVIPSIAKRWEVSPDQRTFIFHLDPAANFSDGSAVRASDVVFTLKKIVDPATESVQLAGLFANLDLANTQAIDPGTVRVTFTTPRPGQLEAFSIPILPERFYSTGNFKSDFNRKVMGSGPYVLKEFRPGQSVRLVRRGNYWREAPSIREINFHVITDDNVALQALLAGELDETKLTSDQWKREKDDPHLHDQIDFRRFYLLSYNFIPWNTSDPLLSDKRVRTALAMCFDRRTMIQSLFYGTARVISGPFTPDQWAYNPEVRPVEYDPAGARTLLGEAGWRDTNGDGLLDQGGRPLSLEMLLASGSATSAAQAQIFQQSLHAAGVELRLTTVDPAVLFERLAAGKYQGTFLQWDVDPDPDVYSLFHSSQVPPVGQNYSFLRDADVDRLIEHSRAELDSKKRRELFHELHALLADRQPYLWTVQVSSKWALRRRVHGVEESNGLGLFNWYPGARQWWLEAEPKK